MSVGMPESLYLDIFGLHLQFAFGEIPYLVGSALTNKKDWRDVDVRILLSDEEWDRQGFGEPEKTNSNGKWITFCMAFSELGKKMTGLPIDFQIQQRTWANKVFPDQPRSALGISLSYTKSESPES